MHEDFVFWPADVHWFFEVAFDCLVPILVAKVFSMKADVAGPALGPRLGAVPGRASWYSVCFVYIYKYNV